MAAIQQLTDYSDEQIAELLDIDRSTVANRRVYIKSELDAAAETLERLDSVVGLENVDPAEFEHVHDSLAEFRSTLTELADLSRD